MLLIASSRLAIHDCCIVDEEFDFERGGAAAAVAFGFALLAQGRGQAA